MLPDDRLLRLEAGESESEFRVRVFDRTGHDDPAFGDGGYVAIPFPAASTMFKSSFATLGPNGELLIEGTLWAADQARFFETIFRLDATGKPDLAFGGQGDAFVRLTETPIEYSPDWKTTVAAFGVDPNGRIVIARHGWTPEDACGGPMMVQRLLASGEPDTEFGTDGQVEISRVNLCLGAALFGVRSDSSIVVGDGRSIAAVDPTGAIDIGFGVDGHLSSDTSVWTRGFVLPDGSLLVFAKGNESANAAVDVLMKFDRNGRADNTYGSGTGSTMVDFGESFTRNPDTYGQVESLLIAPDALHLYASLRILRVGGSIVCRGIAQLSIDGVPDVGFGSHGLTCLDYGSLPFELFSVQTDGAPVFTSGSNSLYRLLPDSKPSPGLLTAVPWPWANESDGRIDVVVVRVAGRDGAASADFATLDLSPRFVINNPDLDVARAGADYVATSGQLNWASGEDGERAATVNIVKDHDHESSEAFMVTFSQDRSSAQLLFGGILVGIRDSDPESNSDPGSGGGGSVSWATHLALLTLLLIHRRRIRRAD